MVVQYFMVLGLFATAPPCMDVFSPSMYLRRDPHRPSLQPATGVPQAILSHRCRILRYIGIY